MASKSRLTTALALQVLLVGGINVAWAGATPPGAGCPPGTAATYQVNLGSTSISSNSSNSSQSDQSFTAGVTGTIGLRCYPDGDIVRVIPSFTNLSCAVDNGTGIPEGCPALLANLQRATVVYVTQNATTGEFIDVLYNESQADVVAVYVGALNGINTNIDLTQLPTVNSSYTYERPSMRMPGATATHTVRRLSDAEFRAPELGGKFLRDSTCVSTKSEAVYLDSTEESTAIHCVAPDGGIVHASSEAHGALGLDNDGGNITATQLLSIQTPVGDFVFAIDVAGNVWRNLIPANGSASPGWTMVSGLSNIWDLSGCEGSPCMMFIGSAASGGDVSSSCWSATSQWSTPTHFQTLQPSTGISCWLNVSLNAVTVYTVTPLGDVWWLHCDPTNITSCSTVWASLGNLSIPALYYWPASDVVALESSHADGVVFAIDTAYLVTEEYPDLIMNPLAASASNFLTEIAYATFACTEDYATPMIATLQFNHEVTLSIWNSTLQYFAVNASVDNVGGCAEIIGYPTAACSQNHFGFVVLSNNGTVFAVEGQATEDLIQVTSVSTVAQLVYTMSTAFGPTSDPTADFFMLQYDGGVTEWTRVAEANWTNRSLPPLNPEGAHGAGNSVPEDKGFCAFRGTSTSALQATEVVSLTSSSLPSVPEAYTTKPFRDSSWYQGPPADSITVQQLLQDVITTPSSTVAQEALIRAVAVTGDDAADTIVQQMVGPNRTQMAIEAVASVVLSVLADTPTPGGVGVHFLASIISQLPPLGINFSTTTRIVAVQESVEIPDIAVTTELLDALHAVSENATDEASGPAAAAYGTLCSKLTEDGQEVCASKLLALHRSEHATPTQQLSALLGLGNSRHPHALNAAKDILSSDAQGSFDVPHRVAATRALRQFDRNHNPPSAVDVAHQGDILLHQAALYDVSAHVRQMGLRTMHERGEPTHYNVLNMLKRVTEPRHTFTQSDMIGYERLFTKWLRKLRGKPSPLRAAAQAGLARAQWLQRMEEAYRSEFGSAMINASTPNSVAWQYPVGGSNAGVTPYAGANYDIDTNGLQANAETGVTGSLFGKDFDILRAGVSASWSSQGDIVGLAFVTAYIWDPVRGQTSYDMFLRQWKFITPFGITSGDDCRATPPDNAARAVTWSTTFARATAFYGIPLIADVDATLALQGSIDIGYGFVFVIDNTTAAKRDADQQPRASDGFLLKAYAQPAASVEAIASGNVRVLVASGGIRGTLKFIDMRLPLVFGINTGHWTFAWSASAVATFLQGTLDLYYSIFWCGWDGWWPVCGGRYNKEGTKNLFTWPGYSLTSTFTEGLACPSPPPPSGPHSLEARHVAHITSPTPRRFDHFESDRMPKRLPGKSAVDSDTALPAKAQEGGFSFEYNDCTEQVVLVVGELEVERQDMNVQQSDANHGLRPRHNLTKRRGVHPHRLRRGADGVPAAKTARARYQQYLSDAWANEIAFLGMTPVFNYKCDPTADPKAWPLVCGNTICALAYYPYMPHITPGTTDVVYSAAKCQHCGSRRGLSLGGGLPTSPGLDRDEFPLNSFTNGGCLARIQAIDPSDNRRHGSSIGGFYRGALKLSGGLNFDITIPNPTALLGVIGGGHTWYDYCDLTDFRKHNVKGEKWYDKVKWCAQNGVAAAGCPTYW
eukprot:CAMPEP_0206316140 /NCGR_PEP_ID=MMETSP0106_2-20121207/15936_1 /ASSEMBLY_ACC=CAM_ASM_000206 /TAXON_ID=81532 /ORGANISM="Acanthoeca-like sp., Strain 10tr" /LENGTH=1641 /DNA_ID=CAMNT_0053747631 /DNA_START=82 /DNA_END=5004 /DNA_ORIENTATION=+